MMIRIRSVIQVFALRFDTDEEFKKVHLQIVEALTDDTNTKGVHYEKGEISQMFPALMLKNSVIEIDKDENKELSVHIF